MSRPAIATAENSPWALYDTKARQWLGDENGPLLYHPPKWPFDLARVVELVANDAHGYRTRICLCSYDGTGTKYAGEVPPKRTFSEALARLEGDDELPLAESAR